MAVERTIEPQVLETGEPTPPGIVGRGGERWSWKTNAAFLAIGLPLIAFSTLSGVYGAGEISKLSLEALQAVNAIPPLTEFQVNHLSQLTSPIGTVTGFIGGFVLTKMAVIDAPRLLRGQ